MFWPHTKTPAVSDGHHNYIITIYPSQTTALASNKTTDINQIYMQHAQVQICKNKCRLILLSCKEGLSRFLIGYSTSFPETQDI
jgi:hypothetical protein